MASIRENERDAAIIDEILERHKHLASQRSNALRFALEYWWEREHRARAAQPSRLAPQAQGTEGESDDQGQ